MRDLLLEIGLEEVPAKFMPPALAELKQLAETALTEQRISFDEVVTYGTPRRIALVVRNIAEKQADLEEEAKGPAVKAAYDADGNPLPGCTDSLGKAASCDLSPAIRRMKGMKLTLLYDAGVALTGEKGAVRMFSRQKGASEEMLPMLENAMIHYASLCDSRIGSEISAIPGAGAAGGLGYGLSLIGGKLTPGADYVLEAIGFDQAAHTADLIITGEGKTDAQTETGKLPVTVARHSSGKPVICLCGKNEAGSALYHAGMDAVFAIADGPLTLEESVSRTAELLEKSAFNLAGLSGKLCGN